jgi:predicted ATP-binding protein involved in virulence
MKLKKARVQNYWSIHDSGWFDVEADKTVIVGPNEAGKTALLRALQTVNLPPGRTLELDPLRDYPRSRYREIDEGLVDLSDVVVATAVFELEDHDRVVLAEFAPHLEAATELHLQRCYDGSRRYWFGELAMWSRYADVGQPLDVLRAALTEAASAEDPAARPTLDTLARLTAKWEPATTLRGTRATQLLDWLDTAAAGLDAEQPAITAAVTAVRDAARCDAQTDEAFEAIEGHIPFFVYFSQYVKVQPRIHLGRLAAQEAAGDIDDEYDFGNLCLLRYLGLSALELAELGRGIPDVRNQSGEIVPPSQEEVAEYQARLDRRGYKLNIAANTLTKAINAVWGEEREVDILPDGQYLKVVVRNEDGARVELDQGSEGFRWLVSFHVVFEAQARSNEANAVLLLDEPGVSLHALKQEAFRETITKLAARNQTLFTTHSPFMVGSDEMQRVRIVELPNRTTGTVVHKDFAVDDARSLFLLQSHFGYVLGQRLFEQQRNLVVEGITDYWYLLTLSDAAREAGETGLDDDLSIVPAGDAGKIVYHASVLHSRDWRVAALFDSDAAGRAAAEDEAFVHLMKKERIYFVGDFYDGIVEQPELEDMLRTTLLRVAREELGLDAFERAVAQPRRSVCDLLGDGIGRSFSKYRLAKAFLRWMRYHDFADLSDQERYVLLELFAAVNQATV